MFDLLRALLAPWGPTVERGTKDEGKRREKKRKEKRKNVNSPKLPKATSPPKSLGQSWYHTGQIHSFRGKKRLCPSAKPKDCPAVVLRHISNLLTKVWITFCFLVFDFHWDPLFAIPNPIVLVFLLVLFIYPRIAGRMDWSLLPKVDPRNRAPFFVECCYHRRKSLDPLSISGPFRPLHCRSIHSTVGGLRSSFFIVIRTICEVRNWKYNYYFDNFLRNRLLLHFSVNKSEPSDRAGISFHDDQCSSNTH